MIAQHISEECSLTTCKVIVYDEQCVCVCMCVGAWVGGCVLAALGQAVTQQLNQCGGRGSSM